jgi:hypothetical protein
MAIVPKFIDKIFCNIVCGPWCSAQQNILGCAEALLDEQ